MPSSTIHPLVARVRASRLGDVHRRRLAFTIVEMLVVVAIIVVLLSLLLVAVSLASRGAQKAQTAFLLTSLNKGVATFRNDFGYVPPVLGGRAPNGTLVIGAERTAVNPPDPTLASFATDLQNWRSETSLTEYLLGAGDRTEDGYGCVGEVATAAQQFPTSPGVKEVPLLGFRDPGADGVWGAWSNPRVLAGGSVMPADGSVASRKLTAFLPSPPAAAASLQANNDLISGKVYGPYIDLKDPRIVGRLDANGNVALPGDSGYDETRPAVFVDYWGRPISYFRRMHAPNDVRTADPRATLGDVVALRPWLFEQGDDAVGIADANPTLTSPIPSGGTIPGDNATSRRLFSAEFALLSEGPNRRSNRFVRADVDEFNKDNLVEVGQ